LVFLRPSNALSSFERLILVCKDGGGALKERCCGFPDG